jgi:hypothetical protein
MSNAIASIRNLFQAAALAGTAALLLAVAAASWRAPGAAVAAEENRPDEARYLIDPVRGRLWLLTRAGVVVSDANPSRRVELGLPGWLWAARPYGCPPDLALGPDGEAVITSNVLPTLWRIDAETLAVTVHPLELDADRDKDIGFSRLVYRPQRASYFAVADHHGSLWEIDLALERAHKLPPSEPGPAGCGVPSGPGRVAGSRCPGSSHPFMAARGCSGWSRNMTAE